MGDIAVSRSFGDYSFKSEPFLTLSNQSDVCCVPLVRDDAWLLLACDGVFDVMSGQDVLEVLDRQTPMNELAAKLTHEALTRRSRDNISVVLAKLSWS